jgi:flagellar basal body-associated protein FliL
MIEIGEKAVPTGDVFWLILIVAAFVVFAVVLAYGSAVAGGAEKAPQSSQGSTKSRRG